MPSYIPTKEADFVDWSGNLVAVSKSYTAEWNLPEAKLSELESLQTQVRALHEKCRTASFTKLDMREKLDLKKQLIRLEEVFVRNHLQNNDAMTDTGRTALRIPIYDKTPSPHPAPDTIPETELLTPLPRTIQLRFRSPNAARWGKPANVHGLECRWVMADAPPAHIDDLLHSEFATRSPLEFVFDEDKRGKRVYLAARWESGAAKKGPWSDIYSAIVP
jgi:hypothetical protein